MNEATPSKGENIAKLGSAAAAAQKSRADTVGLFIINLSKSK